MMNKVYLSRRNLLSLLSKLDRKANGEETACTLIKCDCDHAKFPQTMKQVSIVAVEDKDYYVDRLPGEVLPADNPSN
jgi:hypothetical protein